MERYPDRFQPCQGILDRAGGLSVLTRCVNLQSYFGDAILWFYDGVNGSIIAGLWNPHVVAARQWKITLGYSTLPVGESTGDKVLSPSI